MGSQTEGCGEGLSALVAHEGLPGVALRVDDPQGLLLGQELFVRDRADALLLLLEAGHVVTLQLARVEQDVKGFNVAARALNLERIQGLNKTSRLKGMRVGCSFADHGFVRVEVSDVARDVLGVVGYHVADLAVVNAPGVFHPHVVHVLRILNKHEIIRVLHKLSKMYTLGSQ